MKSQKDIFSTIQEGAQKLTLRPSPAAWRKLENRLGRQRGRVVWLKRLSAAAAVLFLLVGAYWWNLHRLPAAMGFQNGPRPKSLEVLDASGGCRPYCMMLEARKSLPYGYAYPTRKGS